MPIYAYKCDSCGHQKDVLQKVSDPVLSQCPACGGETFRKQVTAAGFQLKGSGWYVTDFRPDKNAAAKKPEADGAAAADKGAAGGDKSAGDAPAAAPAAPATPSAAPSAAPTAAPPAASSTAAPSPSPSASPPASD